MARVLVKYIKLAQGAALRSMLLTPVATILGVGAFAAIAMEGGNLKIEMPNGPNGLIWPAFILWVAVVAFICVHNAIATSKGESVEPEPSGTSAEDALQSPILTRTTEETTHRVETLAERGEQPDLLRRRGGDPETAQVADAGRIQGGHDRSRDRSSQTRGDERRPVSPPPAPAAPAPAPLVTATATASVAEGVDKKKESADT